MIHKCLICNREFTELSGLGRHINGAYRNKTHDINTQQYYDKFLKTNEHEGRCPTCNRETTFLTIGMGYSKYCPNLHCRRVSEKQRIKTEATCIVLDRSVYTNL